MAYKTISFNGKDISLELSFVPGNETITGTVSGQIVFLIACKVFNWNNEFNLGHRVIILNKTLYENKLSSYYLRLAIVMLSVSNFSIYDYRIQNSRLVDLWLSDEVFHFRKCKSLNKLPWKEIKSTKYNGMILLFPGNDYLCLRNQNKYNIALILGYKNYI
jgi:hypothetical protein